MVGGELERLLDEGWYDGPVSRVLDCVVGAGVGLQAEPPRHVDGARLRHSIVQNAP
jgi:hypothetical protein